MNQISTSERNVVAFYDTVAPVISVDASGEYAVLGGLRGLNIIDLESPFKPARILHHHSQHSIELHLISTNESDGKGQDHV